VPRLRVGLHSQQRFLVVLERAWVVVVKRPSVTAHRANDKSAQESSGSGWRLYDGGGSLPVPEMAQDEIIVRVHARLATFRQQDIPEAD
jgi:hypothetical protein